MARPARIQYEGAFCHVMNRGNRREDISIDDKDRKKFYGVVYNIENRYGVVIYIFIMFILLILSNF